MDAIYLLFAIGIVGYLFIAPIFGLLAKGEARRANDEIRKLKQSLAILGQQLAALQQGGAAPEAAAPQPAAPPLPEAPPTEAPVAPEPAQPAKPPVKPAPVSRPAAAPPPRRASGKAAADKAARETWLAGLEESLASRWLVWVGALALALGGAFLVKVSIERGWLGPELRVTLGFLAGLALVAGGEWLRRRPLQQAIAKLQPDYIPPALTGAGLFAAFASLYAAYALYGFLSPLIAFAALALVALGAIALSLLQGPFIALLGLVGGYATPLLVASEAPQPWPLFIYLFVISAAALALVRYKNWWWLAWAALGGGFGWALFWLLLPWVSGSTLPLGLYILALTAFTFFVRPLPAADAPPESPLEVFLPIRPATRLVLAACGAAAALLWGLAQADGYGAMSLGFATFAVAAVLLIAWRLPLLQPLASLGTLLALALLAAWPLSPGQGVEGSGLRAMALIFGLILGGGGFAALWGSRRPDIWAAFSASSALLILTQLYWRVGRFEAELPWAGVALVLAALSLGAAAVLARYRDQRGYDAALGVYAAGCFAAIGLGSAIGLERAWLTVGLALQLPALAWVAQNLRIPLLRHLAWLPAAAVLVRLVLNPEVLNYPLGSLPGFTWVLYGYGIPALAFFFAARWFRKQEDGPLVMLMEAGTIAFTVLLVSFQIRNLLLGRLDYPSYGLMEQSLQSLAWLAMAYGLAWLNGQHHRVVVDWAWRILGGLAAAQVVFFQLLIDNPLWSGAPVGDWPVFDLLTLAYAAPAAFAVAFIPVLRRHFDAKIAAASGFAALALTFFYVNLEVRHLFQGSVLSGPGMSDAELYSYSLAWLLYAALLLALGIFRMSQILRYASLVVVLLAVGKVFLIDVAGLTGLLRALSFAGLGLCTIGIGLFYQRFILLPKKAEEAT